MELDLNKPFTTEDVAQLIASKDDSQHRQLRVSKAGIAYISDEIGNVNIGGLAFRVETWLAGNSYTGAAAATDKTFVAKIEKILRENWPSPSSEYIDYF